MTTVTIPAVTTDDHHITVPTTPPKPIVKHDDASSSYNVTDNSSPMVPRLARNGPGNTTLNPLHTGVIGLFLVTGPVSGLLHRMGDK